MYIPACDTTLCSLEESDTNSCASLRSDVSENFLVEVGNFGFEPTLNGRS